MHLRLWNEYDFGNKNVICRLQWVNWGILYDEVWEKIHFKSDTFEN